MKVIVNENASRSLLVSSLPNISYAIGIWSSVFSLNLLDAWYISVHSEDFWHKWTRDKITDIGELFLYHNVFSFFLLPSSFFFLLCSCIVGVTGDLLCNPLASNSSLGTLTVARNSIEREESIIFGSHKTQTQVLLQALPN